MQAYKLFRVRKDGSLGSLFINRRDKLPLGQWLKAEFHPTKGFAPRPGWHCTHKPEAPHLTMKGRVWCKVEIKDYISIERPKFQGGLWYLAGKMRILEVLSNEC